MNRKIVIRYILMYIPMVLGVVLLGFGIINIISSLLLFLGGYIAIKNTFDYRLIRKNKGKVSNIDNNVKNNITVKNMDRGEVLGVKRKKRNIRVRKREKD